MRQCREVRTCAASLNSLSTAAELGSVELIFVKASARGGCERVGSQQSLAWMPNVHQPEHKLHTLVNSTEL